jgi:hypothetical protein
MKKILLLLSLLFLFVVNTHSQVEIEINDRTLKFENQRELDQSKLPIFESRLENYYDIRIEYDETGNTFSLFFNEEIKEEELNGILSHFNVYEYKITKL